MMKHKNYAYYPIPKNFGNKQKYLVYFLEGGVNFCIILNKIQRKEGDFLKKNLKWASQPPPP